MIVDPTWTFEEALEAAWKAYGGGRQFGAPNRIKMLEQWANVVGRDRAVAELDRAIKEHKTLAEAAANFGLSKYALRTIRQGFAAMPRLTPHVASPATVEHLFRSLPDLAGDSEIGFLTRTVPRLGGLLGYSDSEQFFEVSLPELGRGIRADALFAPAGPARPRVVVEVKRGLLRPEELAGAIQQLRTYLLASGAYAGVVLSPEVVVALTSDRTISLNPRSATDGEIATVSAILERPKGPLVESEASQKKAPAGERLSDLLAAVAAASTNDEKKVSLENLAAEAFALHPSIRCKYRNVRTKSSELDIVCELLPGTPFEFLRESGRYFIVECKNWAKPAGAKEIRDFLGKLRKCRIRVGVYFSRNGITGQEHGTDALREIHSAFDTEGTYVLVLTGQEIETLARLEAVVDLLEDKMDALRFDL
jgi:hypothetical protein